MPALSRPRSSVFGFLPTAASRWLPSTTFAPALGAERDADADAAVARRHPRVLHREVEGDALALEDRLHLARDLAVLARDQAVAVLDHRDARAEAAVHLRELEADVAAAGDDQVLGQRVDRHHRDVGQDRHVGDAVPGRQHRPAADVDEDLRRLEPSRRRPRPRSARRSARGPRSASGSASTRSISPSDAIESATTRSLRALTAFMSTPIGPSMRDAVVAGAPRDVRGARAGDQRLGRDAAVVDAGAAEVLALDQRRLQTGLGEPDRERRAGLAGADHDRVVRGGHGISRSARRCVASHHRRSRSAAPYGPASAIASPSRQPGAGPESPPCPPRPPLLARPPPGWSAG